jgi:hypothetical protein
MGLTIPLISFINKIDEVIPPYYLVIHCTIKT